MLTRIEDQQAASFPVPDFDLKRTLSLASILVRLAAESAVSGSAGLEKLLNQFLYRRASEDLMSRAELVNASGKRVASGAPAQPEPFTTLYELLCECRMLRKEARQAKASRRRRQSAHAARAMSAAERLPGQLDSCSDARERAELLAVASFFLRLAAALLLEKDFPPLPEGLAFQAPD